MLVLTRKKGERIFCRLGDVVIEVCLMEIRGDKVRLGIEAPREVKVHREKVYQQIYGGNKDDAASEEAR